MSANYANITVSKTARLYAKSIIDFYQMPDTQQLGFWLGIPVASDYVVLAIYAERIMMSTQIDCPDDVMNKLREEVPELFLMLH